MYSNDLMVGARSLEAVEEALRTALPSLGLAIVDAFDVANVSEMWERRHHDPSIAIGAKSEGIYVVHVRGPRAPTWNNELTRRLSQLLGGWGACCVNDRMLDDYGYGYYLDGLTIEAAACTAAGRVDERVGFLPEVPDRMIIDLLDEDRNRRNFTLARELLAGPYVSGWPPSKSIRVFSVSGDAITASELPRPPSTLVVAAGHQERIDLPGYEYEVLVVEHDVRVLVARTHLPQWEILERLDAVPCAAFVTNGTEAFVRRRDEEATSQALFANLRTALDAWTPVCSVTETAPMAFTFDAIRPISPWR